MPELPDSTAMLEIKSASQMVKSGTYGMLYGSNAQAEEMVWTGIQRLLAVKGLSVPVDGRPGFRTYTALAQLAEAGLGALGERTRVALAQLGVPDISEDETDEIDSARFRRLEK